MEGALLSWAKQGLALRVSFMSSDTLIAEQCLGPENSHAVDSASVKAERTARFDRIFLQKNLPRDRVGRFF